MATELEVKAVVADPAAVRRALDAARATRLFHGMMRDRRFDQAGGLAQRDEVLRIRTWESAAHPDGRAQVAWKGPTTRSAEGYKQRQEIEYDATDGQAAVQLLGALGYQVVEAIDRYVELFEFEGTTARLEWYPRMDVLMEIEGDAIGIERLIAVAGIPRAECLSDSLAQFTARYAARSGSPAILAEADLLGSAPGWSGV